MRHQVQESRGAGKGGEKDRRAEGKEAGGGETPGWEGPGRKDEEGGGREGEIQKARAVGVPWRGGGEGLAGEGAVTHTR